MRGSERNLLYVPRTVFDRTSFSQTEPRHAIQRSPERHVDNVECGTRIFLTGLHSQDKMFPWKVSCQQNVLHSRAVFTRAITGIITTSPLAEVRSAPAARHTGSINQMRSKRSAFFFVWRHCHGRGHEKRREGERRRTGLG